MGITKRTVDLAPRRDNKDDMSDDDDFDFDEEYFARTYQPLSNLPTPPPSSKNSSASQSPVMETHDDELLEPEFLGAAIHFVNLLPPAASVATPSVPLVQAMLSRTALPMHTVALAVCIMDSLNSRFSLQWRLSCPLAAATDFEGSSSIGKRHMLSGTGNTFPEQYHFQRRQTPQLHIDSVNPEVIILAAIMIAAKFTEDSQEPTRWYASAWGGSLWTCEQINVTERCIMANLGYRIMPLAAPDVLEDAMSDMARAAKSACVGNRPSSGWAKTTTSNCQSDRYDDSHVRSKSCGKSMAVQGPGRLQQLTPIETP